MQARRVRPVTVGSAICSQHGWFRYTGAQVTTRQTTEESGRAGSLREVLVASTRLGLTSFGGPIAHLGYFREEYVTRRGWLDDRAYADLVALCQFLPGPARVKSALLSALCERGC